jgi:hypothetical protein
MRGQDLDEKFVITGGCKLHNNNNSGQEFLTCTGELIFLAVHISVFNDKRETLRICPMYNYTHQLVIKQSSHALKARVHSPLSLWVSVHFSNRSTNV